MKLFIGCSANNEIPEKYKEDCKKYLNTILKDNDLLFGACNDGLMGISYNIALSNNSNIIGISPDFYKENFKYLKCNKEIITKTVNDRTNTLIKESDAIIFLPGGIGTLYELLTCIESKRGNEFNKPIILYNSNNYYNELLSFIDKMMNEGFATKEVLSNFHISNNAKDTLDYINNYNKKGE